MSKMISTVTVDDVQYGPIETKRKSNEANADFIARHFDAVRTFVEANFPEGEWTGIQTEILS